MKKALVTSICLAAFGLCLYGAVGLWQLRTATTTDAPLILANPMLRLTSIGLYAENSQAPLDLGTVAGQIKDRLYLMIAMGVVMFGVCIWRYAPRRTASISQPSYQA
ncbi:MAG: hypothetical protein JNK90_28090 [Planctomycetaceae bacterium]|nr:hypothetical protein [Planctomycetaceae bacterium]